MAWSLLQERPSAVPSAAGLLLPFVAPASPTPSIALFMLTTTHAYVSTRQQYRLHALPAACTALSHLCAGVSFEAQGCLRKRYRAALKHLQAAKHTQHMQGRELGGIVKLARDLRYIYAVLMAYGSACQVNVPLSSNGVL